jgi:hypothetical protein
MSEQPLSVLETIDLQILFVKMCNLAVSGAGSLAQLFLSVVQS